MLKFWVLLVPSILLLMIFMTMYTWQGLKSKNNTKNYNLHALFYKLIWADHDCFKGFSGSSSWYISFFLLYRHHILSCVKKLTLIICHEQEKRGKLKKTYYDKYRIGVRQVIIFKIYSLSADLQRHWGNKML